MREKKDEKELDHQLRDFGLNAALPVRVISEHVCYPIVEGMEILE